MDGSRQKKRPKYQMFRLDIFIREVPKLHWDSKDFSPSVTYLEPPYCCFNLFAKITGSEIKSKD